MNGPERTRAAWRGLGALVFSLTAMAAAPAAARGQERAAGGKAEMEPLVSPWEPAGMDAALGQFELAADARWIYRLGGVDFTLRAGQAYGRRFARYDVKARRWEKLPGAPFGTGGALLAMWPAAGKPVAVAGIEKLGETFLVDTVRVGVYDPPARKWETFSAVSRGLGRGGKLVWWKGSEFLLLTCEAGLSPCRKLAVLDVAKRSVTQIVDVPSDKRPVGMAVLGQTLYLLECGPGGWLWRLGLRERKWEKVFREDNLSLSFMDTLLTWRGALLVWVNPGWPYKAPSGIFRIDLEAKALHELTARFAGPRSRRCGAGVRVGPHFYVFGGQRKDDEWLADGYRYHLDPADPYFGPPRAAPKERFPEHIEDIRLRPAAWGALPREVYTVFVGPRGRTWYELRHPARKEDLAQVQRVIRREFAKPRPQLYGAQPVLFEPGGRVWFSTHSQGVLLGYDGKEMIVHHPPARRFFIGNCPGHGRLYGAGYNAHLAGRSFFVLSQGVEVFDGGKWTYEELTDTPPAGKYAQLSPEPDGRGVLAYLPATSLPLRRWRAGKWQAVPCAGLLGSDPLDAAIGAGGNEIWLFAGGHIVRLGGEKGKPKGFDRLVEQLGSNKFHEREAATDALKGMGYRALEHVKAALAAAKDPEAIARLRLVLEAVTPKDDRTTQVDKYTLNNTRLRLHDPVGGRMLLSTVASAGGEPLGAGLLVGTPGGAWRFYGGRDLAVDWPLWGQGNSGPVVVPGGRKVWLAGKPPRLIDLASGRVRLGPDPRMTWIHAARADGTVFLSRSGRHHDGVMVYRPELAAKAAGGGGN